MYLDTVGYEHLGVTREAFLEHLAAAGLPEAHLELRKMQWQEQQQQDADQGADYGALGGAAAQAGPAVLAQGPAADAGDTSTEAFTDAAASTTGASEGSPLRADGGQPNSRNSHAAPESEAPAGSTGGTGSSLTPLPGLEEESPALLAPAGSKLRAKRGAVQPCGLRVDLQDAVTHSHSEAERQAAEAVASREVSPPQPLLRGGQALLDELAAVGMQHVLRAEEAGQLQHRYPHMYAQAEDLALVGGACSRPQHAVARSLPEDSVRMNGKLHFCCDAGGRAGSAGEVQGAAAAV